MAYNLWSRRIRQAIVEGGEVHDPVVGEGEDGLNIRSWGWI